MTWQAAIERAMQELENVGVPEAQLSAEYLALHALGLWDKSELKKFLHENAEEGSVKNYSSLVDRRKLREPLQYIIGEWEFYGLRLFTTPGALIPRPETELLVEQALIAMQDRSELRVLDIGTGTGAILLALHSIHPNNRYLGIDISDEAIAVAEKNKARLNATRIQFEHKDLNNLDQGKTFDLIVSNPPYVSLKEFDELEPELKFEPRIALTDESDGLTFYRALARIAPTLLVRGGHLIVELGYGQSGAAEVLFSAAGASKVSVRSDLSGIERVLIVRFSD